MTENEVFGKVRDLVVEKLGVDPAKVTRTALENAVSVSKMILTTESIVTDKVTE